MVLLLVLTTAARADVTDVAELFPAETSAYVEIAHPASLSEETGKLLTKSVYADSLKTVHDRFDKVEQPVEAASVQRTALLALLFSPEMLAEVRKFRGLAMGITGNDPRFGPRYAMAVLLGDSTAAGLAVRAYLTTGSTIRRVGVVDGTSIYQRAGFNGGVIGADGKPLPPEEGPGGIVLTPLAADRDMTIAYRSGLLVVGSDPVAVKEILRRASGKADAKSLAADEAFRKKRPTEKFSGAFVYCVPRTLVKYLEDNVKAIGPSAVPECFEFARVAMNWKNVSCLAGTLTVRNDAVQFQANINLDKTTADPFVAILSGPPATADDLRSTGKTSRWATTLSLPTKEKRTQAVLDLADAVAKGLGTLGRKPSEIVAEADRGPGAKLGAELIPGVRAVTLFQPTGVKLPAEGQGIPVVVLHCETPAISSAWAADGAKILGLVAGLETPPTRSSERVGMLQVYSVAGTGMPGKLPIHFAHSGNRVAFGQDRAIVIEALTGRDQDPLLMATSSKPALVSWVRPGSFFPEVKAPTKKPDAVANPQPAAIPQPIDVLQPPGGAQPDPNQPKPPEPYSQGFAKAFLSVPAIPFAIATSSEGVQFLFELPDPATTLCGTIDRFLDWLAKRPVLNEQRGNGLLPQDLR